jgi:hypothetical protein
MAHLSTAETLDISSNLNVKSGLEWATFAQFHGGRSGCLRSFVDFQDAVVRFLRTLRRLLFEAGRGLVPASYVGEQGNT